MDEHALSTRKTKPVLLKLRSSKWLIGFTVFVAAFNVSDLFLDVLTHPLPISFYGYLHLLTVKHTGWLWLWRRCASTSLLLGGEIRCA